MSTRNMMGLKEMRGLMSGANTENIREGRLMTRLSVNINKFALIRNARDTNHPDLLTIAKQILAHEDVIGLTVHPRPDERHIRYQDVYDLKTLLKSCPGRELNVEGHPSEDFVDLVLDTKPTQVTLVPDPPEALTSSFGWNVVAQKESLIKIVNTFKEAGIRTALFLDPRPQDENALKAINPDRVELYTFDYAHQYKQGRETAIKPFIALAEQLTALNIALNAGHDLNLENLKYFVNFVPKVLEVSIGHALVCDAIQYGLDATIEKYLQEIKKEN